jgi:protein tyrosine phosphatase (PTP) superfamily phosphohydrolase (DUF442 family)
MSAYRYSGGWNMRVRKYLFAAALLLLPAVQIGCCGDRFRADHPRLFGQKPSDPYLDRAPPNYPIGPPPGFSNPGGAEILTPQQYPGAAPIGPAPASPSSSGLGSFPPPGSAAPADLTNPPAPPRTSDSLSIPSNQSAEPPKAPTRRMPPPDDPPVQADKPNASVPPSLLDPAPDAKSPLLPPTNVDSSPALPVGIPNFAEICSKVAMGLKPDPEGLDWLRDNKYQTVLHLHRPGADLSAHKEQIGKRGLKYQSFEISPATLTKERLDEFGKIIDQPANQPVFVYDDNGASVGAIWYVHLRTKKEMPAEVAKSQSERLGFSEQGTEEQVAYWTSIRAILDDKKP